MNRKHTLVLRIATILLLMTAGWSPRAYAAALGQEGDPNSPHPTPTWTPTFLPMPTLEPSPTDTPPPDVTATPLTLPTDTPVIMPTDTPLPVDTPPLPPPASGEPVPSATPQLILPPPPFGPTPTATLTNTAPISSTLLLPGASVPLRKRINPVLFIDNLVVAMGYVWLCFATLAILAAAIGAILWVTRRRARTADIPALSPAPDATPPAAPDATPPAAPTTPRVAARRNAPRPPDNFD